MESRTLKNPLDFKFTTWIECKSTLSKVSHFFAETKNLEWFEKKGICSLCHYEQLRLEGYQAPNFGYLKQTISESRTESKPEKDSL